MARPPIDGSGDAAGFSSAFERAVTAPLGTLRTAFLAGFLRAFGAGFFFGTGIDIPGMCICAAAGVAHSTLTPNKNESDFSGNSSKRSALDLLAEGVLYNVRLAAAVLAGAGVAAAAAALRATTILFCLGFLTISHFNLLFCVARNERITI
jgi:hypothetical protein